MALIKGLQTSIQLGIKQIENRMTLIVRDLTVKGVI
jgi:hypothetical protein